jgi:hypothetical protein
VTETNPLPVLASDQWDERADLCFDFSATGAEASSKDPLECPGKCAVMPSGDRLVFRTPA